MINFCLALVAAWISGFMLGFFPLLWMARRMIKRASNETRDLYQRIAFEDISERKGMSHKQMADKLRSGGYDDYAILLEK